MGERNHLEISQNHLYYELQIQGNMPHLTMKCLVSQLTNKANRELKISLSRPMTAGICSRAPRDPEKDKWKRMDGRMDGYPNTNSSVISQDHCKDEWNITKYPCEIVRKLKNVEEYVLCFT